MIRYREKIACWLTSMAIFHLAMTIKLSIVLRSISCVMDGGSYCNIPTFYFLQEYLLFWFLAAIWHISDAITTRPNAGSKFQTVISYRVFGILFFILLTMTCLWDAFTTLTYSGHWNVPPEIRLTTWVILWGTALLSLVKLVSSLVMAIKYFYLKAVTR